MAKGKTKEDIILQAKETILDAIAFYQKYTYKRRSSMVFHIIHSHIIPQPGGEQFIADNFSKIIQFGFKDQEPQEDLLKLMREIVDKLKIDGKLLLHDKMESNYQYILSQHEGDRNRLERLKEICSSRWLYNEFYVIIDFIYNFEKEKEEENLKKELQRKKAESELLADEAKETGCKPKQPQQKKKKKNKSRNKNSKIVTSNIINETEAQDSKKEEEIPEDKEVKELRGELKELRELRFPDKESNEFEDKISNAIENHQQNLKMEAANIDNEKIKNLYVIKISFYLSRITWNLKCYNEQYGETIKQTKGNFGKKEFNWEPNKFITDNLPSIALMVQGIDTNFKQAISMLGQMTCLVYEDCNRQNDEASLEITGNDKVLLEIMGKENQELLGKFLNYLKTWGEWHGNKLRVVRKSGIYSRRKNDQERADEKKALDIIESCVDSLKLIVETDIHKPWCILSHTTVDIYKCAEEMRQCSC